MRLQELNYNVVETLCATERSYVVRARCEQRDRPYILKILPEDKPGPERIGRLRREHALLEKLADCGVVRPEGFERLRHSAMLVMADTGAMSLDGMLRDGPLPIDSAILLARRLVSLVAAIHARGVVHKDINPSNIVVEPEMDSLALIDFGLAAEGTQEEVEAVVPQALEGTLAYLAPEQTGRLNRSIDHRADFYALGATLYELLAGQPPFTETDRLALVHDHLAVAPPALEELRPDVPPALAAIVARLLAKTPEERYQSAEALDRDLKRCQDARAEGTARPAFTPGADDIPLTLQIPQTLYGRDDALAQLHAGFERAIAGSAALTLVTGDPGMGKSALVNELYKPATARGAWFLRGKFDQFQRERPYTALLQVFQDLVAKLLAEDSASLAAWGEHLTTALGSNAGVLTQLIPEMAAVIGEQPAPPALDSDSERHRFHQTLVQFCSALADAHHPLILFFDDVQWADRATLDLLHALLKDPDIGYFHVVGAYRDNEVDADHPLTHLAERLHGAGIAPDRVHLAGLGQGDIACLIADALHTTPSACAQLVEIVVAKTWGNPFFVEHLLKTWYRQGLLWPDAAAGSWRWDIDQLAQTEVADNVVALIKGKLGELDPASQSVVGRAAVLGARFNLAELAAAAGCRAAEALAALQPALDEGFIRPVDSQYKVVAEAGHSGEAWLRFVHDRLQAAALALLSEAERQQTHLAAGRRLREAIADPQRDNRLFAAVTHLNAAAELVTDPAERRHAAELNLVASQRAKRAAAHDQARQMAEAGLALLGEDAWASTYNLCLGLHEQAGVAAYLQADFEAVSRYTDAAMAAARRTADIIDLWRLRIVSRGTRGDLKGALQDGVQALAALGEPIPETPKPQYWSALRRRTGRALGKHGPRKQARAGMVTDPGIGGAMRLMAEIVPMAIQQGHPAFAIVIERHIQLAWQYGNDSSTCWAVATFCIGLMRKTGDVAQVGRFADLAIDLADSPVSENYRPNAYFVVAAFVDIWRWGLAQHLARLDQARHSSEQSGNLDHLGYSTYFLGRSHGWAGEPLPELRSRLARYDRLLGKWDLREYRGWLRVWREAVALLATAFDAPTRFQAGIVAEAALADLATPESNVHTRFSVGFNKVRLGLHYCSHAEIAAWRPTMLSGLHINYGNFEVFPGLAMAILGLCFERAWAGDPLSDADKRHINGYRRELASWRACFADPDYADPWIALAEGAHAWFVRGHLRPALQHWERAADIATRRALWEPAGLAWEFAAGALSADGANEMATPYLHEAVACYEQWGAEGKVAFLRHRHALPLPSSATSSSPSRSGAHSTTGAKGQGAGTASSTESEEADLDFQASMRAAQTLAEEIQPEALMEKLMRVVAQTAGATHGYLLLGQSEAELRVAAQLDIDQEPAIQVGEPAPLADGDDAAVPLALVRYSARTRETVAVADCPAGRERFSDEPVLAAHGAQSVLALPLVNQGKLTGLLYLEHRRSRDVFSGGRASVLSMLATQMAISLENAYLYRDMEDQVAQRTRELERLASTDSHTGAWRRGHFLDLAKRSFEQARRTGEPLSVVMLDIDHFKTINDVYGHDGGDRVLEAVSAVCRDSKRSYDAFGRLGGEEFAVLMPTTDGESAMALAERLRTATRQTTLTLPRTQAGMAGEATVAGDDAGETVTVTLSLGVAAMASGDEAVDAVIQRADEALYQAKTAGRNRAHRSG